MGQLSPLRQSDTGPTVVVTGGGRTLHKGDILAGKYEFEEVIGTGAMGVVVAARHVALGERVAIKFLLPEVMENAEAVTRFMREARAAVKIKSEHVARVTDVGAFDDGAPFIVMEYLEGSDLSTWLKAQGRLAASQAVEFVLQACEAIAEAHVLGIVHRDLKPANLFCARRRDGTLAIKVLDFGISKVSDSWSPEAFSMTSTAVLIGSPGYMSPEQLHSSRDVDHRTDIWSLGVLLFELLTGTSPFEGESLPELLLNITTQAQTSLRELRPDLPASLEAIIGVCLRKDRTERYSDVGQLAQALRPFAPPNAKIYAERALAIVERARLGSTLQQSSSQPQNDDALGAGTAERTRVTWGHTAAPMQRPPRWVMLSALGVFVALGLGLLAWTHTRANLQKPPARLLVAAVGSVSLATRAQSSVRAIVANDSKAENVRASAVAGAAHRVAARAATTQSKWMGNTRRGSGAIPEAVRAAPERLASGSLAAANGACDPPYDLDAMGRKHFKRECFRN